VLECDWASPQSNLYVSDQANLGGFNSSTNCTNNFNNLQCITSPPIPQNDPGQGYWASPAYWHYKDQNSADHYMLYYSVTSQDPTVAPKTLNAYQLNASGSSLPIPSQYASTSIQFCPYSPTPSLSSSGAGYLSGIVWTIEHQNNDNPHDCATNGEIMHAALHAFNASNVGAAELYNSRGVHSTNIGGPTPFSTPTIFKGQVYMGTKTEVDVFGLCSTNGHSGCLQ